MPGTVSDDYINLKSNLGPRPSLLISATLTGGRATAPSTTTLIDETAEAVLPHGVTALGLAFRATGAATDAADECFVVAEVKINGEFFPALSTDSIKGNDAEPVAQAAVAISSAGSAGANSDTARVKALNRAGTPIAAGSHVKLGFYVTADADATQDDLFAGVAELWAIP